MNTTCSRNLYSHLFHQELNNCTPGEYDDAALPSYTHKNICMRWLFWRRIDAALRMAGDIRNLSVLDFGCGGGATFAYLSQYNCEIHACDKHLSLIQRMCESLKIRATLCDDIFALTNKTFDLILALDVLEHLENLPDYINKFKDLSHQNTRIIISGPTENLLYKAGRKLAGFSGDYHVRNIYHIEDELSKHGCRRQNLRRLYFPITLFRVSVWKWNGFAR